MEDITSSTTEASDSLDNVGTSVESVNTNLESINSGGIDGVSASADSASNSS